MMRVIPNSADDISNRNDPRRYPKTRQCRAKESPRPHHFRHDLQAVASLQAESDIDRAYYGQEYGSELFLLHLREKQMKRKCGYRKQRADNGRRRGKKYSQATQITAQPVVGRCFASSMIPKSCRLSG